MARYRKKPIIIEAFRMGIDSRPDWFQDKVTRNEIVTYKKHSEGYGPFVFVETYCMIKTLEGEMIGNYGDYIIKGVNGEVYPCKPNIFKKTYEKVGDSE